MPDIFKKREFVESEDTVQIPDISLRLRLGLASDPLEDQDEPPREGEAQHDAETPQKRVVKPPRQLTRQELEDFFAEELAEIRQNAAEVAYADALQQKKGELKECISQVEQTLNDLQELQDEYVDLCSQELKYLAIDIAEKIMYLRIAEDDISLSALVLQTVSTMKRSKWLSVDLSERLINLVGFMSEELKKAEYHGRAEVNQMACPDDTVRVNTEDGTVIASVSVQINKLREAFANADRE